MKSILHFWLTEDGWDIAEWCYRYHLQHGTWAALTDISGEAPPSKANVDCLLRFYDKAGNVVVTLRCPDVRTAMEVTVGAIVHQ